MSVWTLKLLVRYAWRQTKQSNRWVSTEDDEQHPRNGILPQKRHWTLHYSLTLIAWSGSDVAVTSPSVNPEPERMVENKRLWGPNLVDGGEESWEEEATEREKRWRSGKIKRATSVRGETRTKSQRMRRRHQEATEREGSQGKGIAMYLMQIQSPSSWLNWRSL